MKNSKIHRLYICFCCATFGARVQLAAAVELHEGARLLNNFIMTGFVDLELTTIFTKKLKQQKMLCFSVVSLCF